MCICIYVEHCAHTHTDAQTQSKNNTQKALCKTSNWAIGLVGTTLLLKRCLRAVKQLSPQTLFTTPNKISSHRGPVGHVAALFNKRRKKQNI